LVLALRCIRERYFAAERVTDDAANIEAEVITQANEILGCCIDRVWFGSTEGLAMSAQVDQDKPPVWTRFGDAFDEGAEVPT
jgi:hypothetical protein